jgi:hypothetical protein
MCCFIIRVNDNPPCNLVRFGVSISARKGAENQMANHKQIVRGTGVLSGEGRKRQCRFQVTKTSLLVNERSAPVDVAYSNLSITDSDDWPDGMYELEFHGGKEPLRKKNGFYLGR